MYSYDQNIHQLTHTHTHILKYLLKHGANVESIGNDQARPLYMAAQEGHAEIVRLLLKHGAQVDAPRNNGATPLLIAVQKSHRKVVELLLEAGTLTLLLFCGMVRSDSRNSLRIHQVQA